MLLIAWVIFPLILLALCAGVGLLVDAASGRRLSGPLVPVVGLAGIIVVGSFTTISSTTAPITTPLIVALAIAGVALSRRWRFGRPDPLVAGVAVAVFFIYGAPVIASGEPTFAGYIKLDDTATWLAITDRIMEHGRSLEGLAPSTYQATLDFNVGGGYPVGVFVPFGAAQEIAGVDLAWVFQPYVSFLVAMLALALWQVVGSFTGRRGWQALAVLIAAQPALLLGYALWGGVKEVAAAALVALAAALAPAVLRADASWRDAALLSLCAAAIVGVLTTGGLVWLGPMLLVAFIWLLRESGIRRALVTAFGFLAPLIVLVIPVIVNGIIPPTSSPLTDPEAQGNLRGPLNPFQVLGIWPASDFRFDPEASVVTPVLIALAVLAAGLGAGFAITKRRVPLLLYASALVAAAAIVIVGSPWAGGKALATAAPVALSLALAGSMACMRIDRLTGVVLAVAVAGGVVWSNVLAYGDVSLAPYDRFAELEQIGVEFAGEGPALLTEYNPYGARHFLRELDAEGASELRFRPVNLRGGGTPEKGEDVDVDDIELDSVVEYRTIVTRSVPGQSRPPAYYELTGLSDHYEVWQRPEEPGAMSLLDHMPVGGDGAAYAVPDCSEVRGLSLLPLVDGIQGAYLVAAPPDSLRKPITLPLDRAPQLCGRKWDWIATAIG